MNEINKKGMIPRRDLLKLKKEIGKRFKQFRSATGKSQSQLAKELNVYQSSITNIEVGKTFPSIKYSLYFYEAYNLNITWLISGDGDMFCTDDKEWCEMVVILENIHQDERRQEPYLELLKMMQTPEIEQIILGKLQELKAIQAFQEKRAAKPVKRKRKRKPKRGK